MATNPKQGEVWRVDFEPTRGSEIKKTSPAVVLSNDKIGHLQLRLVVPLTGWQPAFDRWPWMTKIEPTKANGLNKPTCADAFQTRSVSVVRFVNSIGAVTAGEFDLIVDSSNRCIRVD